jgi:hypothetical protein
MTITEAPPSLINAYLDGNFDWPQTHLGTSLYMFAELFGPNHLQMPTLSDLRYNCYLTPEQRSTIALRMDQSHLGYKVAAFHNEQFFTSETLKIPDDDIDGIWSRARGETTNRAVALIHSIPVAEIDDLALSYYWRNRYNRSSAVGYLLRTVDDILKDNHSVKDSLAEYSAVTFGLLESDEFQEHSQKYKDQILEIYLEGRGDQMETRISIEELGIRTNSHISKVFLDKFKLRYPNRDFSSFAQHFCRLP